MDVVQIDKNKYACVYKDKNMRYVRTITTQGSILSWGKAYSFEQEKIIYTEM